MDPLTDPRWDAYVRAHPRGDRLPPRRMGGDPAAARTASGPDYLALETDDGRLTGVLPLLRKKGLISDARMRSIPVFSYGGPLGDSRGRGDRTAGRRA